MVNTVSIDASLNTSMHETNSTSPSIVQIRSGAANHLYVFYIDSTLDLVYRKSTDEGVNWSAINTLDSTDDWITVAVWYDRWSPNDTTGNLIHICASSATNDRIVYFSLDVSSDTAGTNNNVNIISWTNFSGPPGGSISICKGANGDLYAGAIGNSGPVGLQIARSTNSGSSWTDITSPASGTDIGAEFTEDDDSLGLVPLLTDNDIILVGIDDNGTNLDSYVFDAVAGTWGSAVVVDSGTSNVSATQPPYSLTINKTTGDVYAVFKKSSYTASGVDTVLRKFSDSTRTWGSELKILDRATRTSEALVRMSGVGITYDQTNGVLFVLMNRTEGNDFVSLECRLSSDDGVTWSHPYVLVSTGVPSDDFRRVSCPPILLSTDEAWYGVWYDHDGDDLEGMSGGLEYKTFSGVVYDSDGTTTVSGADVRVFRKENITQANYVGAIDMLQGKVTTAAGGAYKIGVFGNQADDTADETYYAIAYKQGGTDADDESGISREDTSD